MKTCQIISFLSVLSMGAVVARDMTLFESHATRQQQEQQQQNSAFKTSLDDKNNVSSTRTIRGSAGHRRLQVLGGPPPKNVLGNVGQPKAPGGPATPKGPPGAPKVGPGVPKAPGAVGPGVPKAPGAGGPGVPKAPGIAGPGVPKAPGAGGPGVPVAPKGPVGPGAPKAPGVAGPGAPKAPGVAGGPAAPKAPGGPGGPLAPKAPAAPGTSAIRALDEEEDTGIRFDFIVAGFPKCGTTTLLKTFEAHPETAMSDREQCSVASPGQADPVVHKKLDETLATLDQDPNVKRSFKCPTAMYNYKSLVRMEKHSPDAKFVVGMRHPVLMMQSFYNYRISEIYKRFNEGGGEKEEIIPLHDIIASGEPWLGVSMESTRFELFLMQMGKTDMTPEQLADMVGQPHELAVKPTTFKVFIYTVDQLEDEDEVRTGELRRVMQEFLGLQQPIPPFGKENVNHHGSSGFDEAIEICDPEWAYLRARLVEQGKNTAVWLRDQFMHSPDVTLANPDHFVETLEGWGVDPCEPELVMPDPPKEW